ncbi:MULTISPECIES: 30S ribosomal protein S15 [unclassified Candidatus Cardinium]|uniref:30S ribosomal protein S15 n=1 Tax=unclassified Candidatus Cardinium TaxID=2641185 RepID=UPI001FB264BA|nr:MULTISPECIES: 30S ribosomal protein S15 [unclassified Candidatus Cardinium]
MKLTNQNNKNKEALFKTFVFDHSDKGNLFKTFGLKKSEQDSGSYESQIALLTYEIKHLTAHLKLNKKDHSAKYGLAKKVGKRKKIIKKFKEAALTRYRTIITELGLRK